MSEIQIFTNQELGEIRTITYNGELAFVAKDVAERLGYTWNVHLLDKIPDEWKGVKRIHSLGGEQDTAVLTEPGLYFFLARSDKPLALPFQKWIAGEVIPSIRKTGQYSIHANSSLAQSLSIDGIPIAVPLGVGFSVTRSKTGVLTVRVKEPTQPRTGHAVKFSDEPERFDATAHEHASVPITDSNKIFRTNVIRLFVDACCIQGKEESTTLTLAWGAWRQFYNWCPYRFKMTRDDFVILLIDEFRESGWNTEFYRIRNRNGQLVLGFIGVKIIIPPYDSIDYRRLDK